MKEVLNRLLARFVNWELLLIYGKPALIPQLEWPVGVVKALIDERFIPVGRMFAAHSNEAQDARPTSGMCPFVAG